MKLLAEVTPLNQAVTVYLPWLLSAITIWMTLLAGNLHRKAWLVGLANQALWAIWIITTATWGLVPLNIALWVVYGRNHLRWRATPSLAAAGSYGGIDRSDSPLWRARQPDDPGVR